MDAALKSEVQHVFASTGLPGRTYEAISVRRRSRLEYPPLRRRQQARASG